MYKIFFDLVHVLDLIEKNGKVNHWKLASDQDKVCFIKTGILYIGGNHSIANSSLFPTSMYLRGDVP